MKVLNRPMFRMGGPIKEGIMDGIKEPRRGFQQAGFVDPIMDPNLMAIRQQQNLDASKAFQNIFTPKNVSSTEVLSGKEEPPGLFGFKFNEPIKPADLVLGEKTKQIIAENKVKRAEKNAQEIAARAEEKNVSDFDKSLLPKENLNLNENNNNNENNNLIDTKDKKTRVNEILSSLGYDRASKNALYDAMIKAGQRISRKGLGAENLVSDVIAETSQSYDKPEKLREAANLMDVQQQLKLDQIEASKDTRSPIQKNADYFLESGVAENTNDAIRMARNLPVTVSETFQTKVKEFGKSGGLDQTAIDLSERGQFGKLKFEGKVNKKYKGKPLSEFLGSAGFKGDGVYTADGKILVIENGVIKQTIVVRGSVEDSLFNFGGED